MIPKTIFKKKYQEKLGILKGAKDYYRIFLKHPKTRKEICYIETLIYLNKRLRHHF